MSMQNRNRAELNSNPPQEELLDWHLQEPDPEEPNVQSMPTESSYSEIIQLLGTVRSQQIVVRESFDQIIRKLESSEGEKKELLEQVHKAVLGLSKREEELLQSINKQQTKKEQQLTIAITEVKSLKQELTRGFLEMTIKTKTPFSQKLAMMAAVSSISTIGGVVVFLLLTLGVR